MAETESDSVQKLKAETITLAPATVCPTCNGFPQVEKCGTCYGLGMIGGIHDLVRQYLRKEPQC